MIKKLKAPLLIFIFLLFIISCTPSNTLSLFEQIESEMTRPEVIYSSVDDEIFFLSDIMITVRFSKKMDIDSVKKNFTMDEISFDCEWNIEKTEMYIIPDLNSMLPNYRYSIEIYMSAMSHDQISMYDRYYKTFIYKNYIQKSQKMKIPGPDKHANIDN